MGGADVQVDRRSALGRVGVEVGETDRKERRQTVTDGRAVGDRSGVGIKDPKRVKNRLGGGD